MNNTTTRPNAVVQGQQLVKFENIKSTIMVRSISISLIVGSLLNLINVVDAIFSIRSVQYLPLLLLFVTPFVVVMYSQRASINSAWQNINNNQTPKQLNNLISTAFSHGIPAKAFAFDYALPKGGLKN